MFVILSEAIVILSKAIAQHPSGKDLSFNFRCTLRSPIGAQPDIILPA